MRPNLQTGARKTGTVAAILGAAYGAVAALTWYRYGQAKRRHGGQDSRLESFLPDYEVVERHCIVVDAPAEITFSSACNLNLEQSPIVRGLFKIRELVLGAQREGKRTPLVGLVEQAKLWGWGVLSEDSGHEIVFGAVTQPWIARPVFRALRPEEFRDFQEPGYAKIAWSLRTQPVGPTQSIACTETRVVSTDTASRQMFRGYWSLVMPGVVLIRWILLRLVKHAAESLSRKSVAIAEARLALERGRAQSESRIEPRT